MIFTEKELHVIKSALMKKRQRLISKNFKKRLFHRLTRFEEMEQNEEVEEINRILNKLDSYFIYKG